MSDPLWTPTPDEIAALRRVLEQQDARITELEAQLAQTWLPVWGIEINGIEVDAGGNSISMTAIDAHGCKWYAESDLPDNIRLCRRQEADHANRGD